MTSTLSSTHLHHLYLVFAFWKLGKHANTLEQILKLIIFNSVSKNSVQKYQFYFFFTKFYVFMIFIFVKFLPILFGTHHPHPNHLLVHIFTTIIETHLSSPRNPNRFQTKIFLLHIVNIWNISMLFYWSCYKSFENVKMVALYSDKTVNCIHSISLIFYK